MLRTASLSVVPLLLAIFASQVHGVDDANTWLAKFAKEATKYYQEETIAEWNYEVNMTEENQKIMIQRDMESAEFFRNKSIEAQKKFKIETIGDTTAKRALELITDIGISASPNINTLKKIAELTADMLQIYSTATFSLNGKDLPLQPNGLASKIATSRDYDELKNVWKGWRDVSGKKMRKKYMEWVRLSNEAITDGGKYNNLGESWKAIYGKDFEKSVEKLMIQMKPLYQLFHTFVKRKLKKKYGADKFPKSGTIPAHLLGNMWAQEWNNIQDIVLPKGADLDVTKEMINQQYDVMRMFKTSEHFFTSLGLKNMTNTFWNKTIMTKPPGIEMVCHASAWDFYGKDDYRIKMCTEITMEDLITIHHEMGHIQYFQQYSKQPVYFRDGANPGFHEAVGDTLALSVSTPEHLVKIGLLKSYNATKETDLNFLMSKAMEKLVFLPFAYVVDTYRWNVFNGSIPSSELNSKWWESRCENQGISAPVPRSENDFDPGSKMHIAGAVPYIRYFVSHIIQFQFHKALCKESNHTGPLHKCDIYNNIAAGKKFEAMLKSGASVSWRDAMKAITGQSEMDAGPMLEYFKPLSDWLNKHVKPEEIGWNCQTSSFAHRCSLNIIYLLAVMFLSFINFC